VGAFRAYPMESDVLGADAIWFAGLLPPRGRDDDETEISLKLHVHVTAWHLDFLRVRHSEL